MRAACASFATRAVVATSVNSHSAAAGSDGYFSSMQVVHCDKRDEHAELACNRSLPHTRNLCADQPSCRFFDSAAPLDRSERSSRAATQNATQREGGRGMNTWTTQTTNALAEGAVCRTNRRVHQAHWFCLLVCGSELGVRGRHHERATATTGDQYRPGCGCSAGLFSCGSCLLCRCSRILVVARGADGGRDGSHSDSAPCGTTTEASFAQPQPWQPTSSCATAVRDDDPRSSGAGVSFGSRLLGGRCGRCGCVRPCRCCPRCPTFPLPRAPVLLGVSGDL
jgi:hypothetical protein